MKQSAFNQGDHQGGNDVALTPPEIIRALGRFDLDPCFGKPRPWNTADRMLCVEDGEDGLTANWGDSLSTRVWLNQPYSKAAKWAERMAKHRNGTMLVFHRSETQWFQKWVYPHCSGIFSFAGRLNFYTPEGQLITTKAGKVSSAGAPSVLVTYDPPEQSTRVNLCRVWLAMIDGLIKGHLTVYPSRRDSGSCPCHG